MHVVLALGGDGGLVEILLAPGRLVVMAHEHPGLAWQGEQLLDRLVQGARVAAGKIAAGGAVVGHEQGVTDEGGVTDDVGHAGRGVARGVEGAGLHVADLEAVAVVEQVIELTAIGGEPAACVEQLAEGVLHHGDAITDRQFAAQLLLEIGRRAQMVGVHMGFQQPLHPQVLVAHVVDQALRACMGGAAGCRVVVQHRVDHRTLARFRVADHVAVGKGRGIEEGFDVGIHGAGLLFRLNTGGGIFSERS